MWPQRAEGGSMGRMTYCCSGQKPERTFCQGCSGRNELPITGGVLTKSEGLNRELQREFPLSKGDRESR